MDFGFSEDQEAIRDTARRFARERLMPSYQTREAEGTIDRALIREMGELGLLGLELSEALGGLGLDCITAGIVIEEISYADINVGYVNLLVSLMGSILSTHASPEIAQEFVPKLCSGEIMVALGLTEPRGGSDAAHLITKAKRDGDAYILSGEKTSISLAEQCDYAVVFARTSETNMGAGGVSAFLVPLDDPQVTRSSFNDVGSKAVGRGSLFFDGLRVDARFMIGDEGEGFRQVMNGFDYSRALIGLQTLAPACASLDETWAYVTERQAFSNPLAKYQGVTEPLAEAETLLKAAKLLCYQTLWLRDQDLPRKPRCANGGRPKRRSRLFTGVSLPMDMAGTAPICRISNGCAMSWACRSAMAPSKSRR